jgi:hypothetical protein
MEDPLNIPDFSHDDFADDKDIQKYRAAIQAYEKMVDDVLHIVRDKLNIEDSSHKDFDVFFMFKTLKATVTRSLSSSDPNMPLHVSVAKYTSSYPTGKYINSGCSQYLFGYFLMNKKFPKTYIHQETIREKITDLILKSEVDFEHSKEFSKKFYVLTEDKYRLLELLQFKNLDDLALYPEMEIEINGNACLFRSSRKAISLEEATAFADLAKALVKIFN